VTTKLRAVYRIRSDAGSIAERARMIAVEQSVEMPVAAIDDATVLSDIVGQVEDIIDRGGGLFDATIALDVATTGFEAGQLLNTLFGNSSIHDDVTLQAIALPPELSAVFGGPRHGTDGLRTRVHAHNRALTCSALKPQGLSATKLGDLAYQLALGGLDYIKDDHGLADQTHAPFADRIAAVAAGVERAKRATGKATRYLPNISGNLDDLRTQVDIARAHALDTLLITPMIAGLPSFATLVRENPEMAFIAHPAMAGSARISPPALLGTLFRVLGADAVIFPNHGGRFGYSPHTCRAIADTARARWPGIKPTLPVPAGGMKIDRIPEMLAFYGTDAMLLIGGDLLAAREHLTTKAAAFQRAVELFDYAAAPPLGAPANA
jgi:ribulose-bisphosphate carboxylase large chain